MIRIGLDYRPALLTSAGIGRAVRELSRGLAARADVEPHLFGHSFAAVRRPDKTPPGARLHRLPIPGRSLPFLRRLGLDAARLCGGVPLFHWTDYVHPPVRRAQTILTIHDLAFVRSEAFHGPETGWLLEQCRRAARQAAQIVCPTRATANDVREVLERDARVIPFGDDHVPATTGAAPLHEPYFVTLGTIEPRKNHLRLLEAWRALPDPPRLVVLGRIGWECDDAVRALQQEPRILWRTDATDAEVFAFVAHAEALVYPSRLEGFGFPPLEARALGTRVVAGETAALRETLGDDAVFCDPLDVESIREAMLEVQTRTAPPAGARLPWQTCAASHAALYREVLA